MSKSSALLSAFLAILGVTALVYHAYFVVTGLPNPMVFRPAHLLFFAPIPFLTSTQEGWRKVLDLVIAALVTAALVYVLLDMERIETRIWLADDVFPMDYVAAAIVIGTLIEGARRAFGWPLPILALLSLTYAFLGDHIPGHYGHQPEPASIIVDHLFLTTGGVFGPVLGASAEIVFLFVVFGAFLSATKVDKTLFSLATLAVGHAKGAPAKLEVIASALFGMVSGSTSANVVATGSITIPMMKKRGYDATFAAAVEAASSTGGQIMPPIMGATAFLMAALIGVPYLDVMIAATIPALFYFAAVFMVVQIYSDKLNLSGLAEDEKASLRDVSRELHRLLPILVLTGLIIVDYSPGYACVMGLGLVMLLGLLEGTLNLRSAADACRSAIEDGTSIAFACAAAGIIVGVITLTGLGLKLSNTIAELGGTSTFLALTLTMLIALIMGMGVPTPAAYITTAAVMAPALVRLGFDTLTSHMFIFFYACLSSITPPVAIGAYIAAGIAQAPPLRTGFVACRIAIGAFIVPYLFAYSPDAMFMRADIVSIAIVCALAFGGLYAAVFAMEGWLRGRLPWWSRILLVVSAGLQFTVILPMYQRGIGFAILLAIYVWRRVRAASRAVDSAPEVIGAPSRSAAGPG